MQIWKYPEKIIPCISCEFSSYLSVKFAKCLQTYCNNQEDLTWQEILQTSIYLFKVSWNDHLVNYFSLMYRYGINTNILHLTFSRAELWSFCIQCQSFQEHLIKKTKDLTIYGILCQNIRIFKGHLFKYYPVKIPQNCFISSTYLNQTCVQVSNFHVH